MADSTDSNEERPCLHCLIGDLIDEFYAEYGSLSGEKDTVDVDEIITALAKTVAEMTFGSDAAVRQRIEILNRAVEADRASMDEMAGGGWDTEALKKEAGREPS